MKVSLVVVAYNEENILPQLLSDFKKQTYPHNLIEIVLVDSMSIDNTRRIMEDFSNESNGFYSVKILENPGKFLSHGWNVAIKNYTGDIILRVDAHAHIPEDFVENNVKLQKTGEYVTGGVRPAIIEGEDSPWNKSLLEIENSVFGSSINKARRSTQKQYVKTMFHAAYRREVFEKVGGYDEMLIRTEDNEMNYRIRKAGYKLCFDPSIKSYQYARSNLKRMIKQKYSNGYWIGLTLGVCPGSISIYHIIPFLFVLGILFTSIFSLFGYSLLAKIMWGLYLLFTIVSTLIIFVNKKGNIYTLLAPILFLILHISYGLGTLVGLIKMPLFRKKYFRIKNKRRG